MKRTYFTQYTVSLAVMGLTFMLAPLCVAGPTIVVSPPSIVVSAPPPPPPTVEVTAVVPDSYVWDGYEYVGVVGDQYYYLGPGNVWVVMDAPRLHRFNGWERDHADWRAHAIHNTKYRDNDRHPNATPLRDMHQNNPTMHDKDLKQNQNHDQNHDRVQGYGQDKNLPGGPPNK